MAPVLVSACVSLSVAVFAGFVHVRENHGVMRCDMLYQGVVADKFDEGCEGGDDCSGFALVNGEGVRDTFAQVDGITARVANEEDTASINAPECSFVVSVPLCGVTLSAVSVDGDSVRSFGHGCSGVGLQPVDQGRDAANDKTSYTVESDCIWHRCG